MSEYRYKKERMVRWFDPGQLLGTGVKTALSTIFGSYADQREVQAALDSSERIYFALHGVVVWKGGDLAGIAREGGEELLGLCRQIGEVLEVDLADSPGLHAVSNEQRGDAPPEADWYIQTASALIYITEKKGDRGQDPFLVVEGYSDDSLFFDYIADLGDGWKSTYTMASLAASDLELDEQSRSLRLHDGKKDADTEGKKALPRGRFLVFGGDEVYPTASRDEYRNRLVGPYHDASVNARKEKAEEAGGGGKGQAGEKASRIFAIPGNHDWYDGLTAFTRLFCQERRIGGWRTQQARSYFAVRLSKDWWLWGVDTQLKADIDAPQLSYFRKVAQDHMRPGDRVVLCTPEPTWVYTLTHGERDAFNNLYFLQKKIIEKNNCILAVTIAGDLHHYCRYQREGAEDGGGDIYKITAGGGGAFLHGTGKNATPEKLPLNVDLNDGDPTYKMRYTVPQMKHEDASALFPSAKQSLAQTLKGFAFPFTNWTFSLFVGLLYLIFGWLLQSASKVDPDTDNTLMDDLAKRDFSWATLQCTMSDVLHLAEYSPPLVLFALFLYGALTAFADVMRFNPNRYLDEEETDGDKSINWRYRWGQAKRFVLRFCILGGTHTAAHLLAALGILWLGAQINIFHCELETGTWRNVLLTSGELFIVGGFVGCIVMGAYLLSSYYVIGVHNNELFSALRVQSYKNFLRLHLSEEGLKVYPIGMEKVPLFRSDLQDLRGQAFVKKVGARLIEDVPIIDLLPTEK